MKPLLKIFKTKEIDPDYFHNYGGGEYSDNYKAFTVPADSLVEQLVQNGIDFNTLLDIGCASGELVKDLRDIGVDAYGIENNKYVMKNNIIPRYCKVMDARNIDKFKEKAFDILYTNCLMYLFPQEIPDILKKFNRVCSKAVYLWVPFIEEIQFQDKYRRFLASKTWWEEQFKNAGFFKVTENIYSITKNS